MIPVDFSAFGRETWYSKNITNLLLQREPCLLQLYQIFDTDHTKTYD